MFSLPARIVCALAVLAGGLTLFAPRAAANVAEMVRIKSGSLIYEDVVGNDGATSSSDLNFSVDFNFRSNTPGASRNHLRVKARSNYSGSNSAGGYASNATTPGLLVKCDMASSAALGLPVTLYYEFDDGVNATTLGSYTMNYDTKWHRLNMVYDSAAKTASLLIDGKQAVAPAVIATTTYNLSGHYFMLEGARMDDGSTEMESIVFDNINVASGISETFENLASGANLNTAGGAAWVVRNRYDFWAVNASLNSNYGEPVSVSTAPRYMEKLNRGMLAVKVTGGVYVGWRLFGTDDPAIGFNLYRNGIKVNSSVITSSTNYLDSAGTASSTYYVKPVLDGVEQTQSEAVTPWSSFYKQINLDVPAMETMPDATTCTYTPNDCSVGDLDGDGEMEIVVKWDPSNSKDNSQDGYTGDVFLEAYKMNSTKLWRIDLGKNIRAGAHYTQFMVYDLDGDGKAEVACKTAPGTIDGRGNYVLMGSDSAAVDYRNSDGYILSGPEYLTIFNGQTGANMATTSYVPLRGTVSSWGDSYGNRVDRFLACIAYLDGVHPSLVMCRGYYTRTVLAAWNWRNGQLNNIWTFDSNTAGNSAYAGQGNHNLAVGDVDGDGYDEIIYGSCAIDHDGKGLYSTGLQHGDALHFGDLDPSRPGYEVFACHEDSNNGESFRDAATGEIIFQHKADGDNGRACAADIDPSHLGDELWSSSFNTLRAVDGTTVSTSRPSDVNFAIWWDGDLSRELLDGDKLDKWNPATASQSRLVTLYNYGVGKINGTKSDPCLQADLFGDWREEIVLPGANYLRIFTTTTVTPYRIFTLLHDPIYRMGIAWQNVGYNQPPHTGFYLGNGMSFPVKQPNIRLVGGSSQSSTGPECLKYR